MQNSSENQLALDQVEAEPKVDLHVHLDGALTPENIMRVAQEHGITVPGPTKDQPLAEQTPEALRESGYPNPGPFDAGKSPEEFDRFLKMFDPQAFSVMQTPESIGDATLEVVRNLAAENVIYAELRFAPNYHTQQGHTMDEIVQGVLNGMLRGQEETGVTTKLILCIPREINAVAANPEHNGHSATDIVETALRFQDDGVVAIDLASNEFAFPPEQYIEAFEMTFGSKLMRTVHAGETAPNKDQLRANIHTALTRMKADGLGHALPLARTPGTLRSVAERGVRVERQPISNKCMTVGDGNFDMLDRLVEAGVLVSVGSDDPGIFGPECSLSQNLLAVANKYGVGIGGIRHLTSNAINTAFLPDNEKEVLRTVFEGRKKR